jgi:hypothetical protein
VGRRCSGPGGGAGRGARGAAAAARRAGPTALVCSLPACLSLLPHPPLPHTHTPQRRAPPQLSDMTARLRDAEDKASRLPGAETRAAVAEEQAVELRARLEKLDAQVWGGRA